MIDATGNPRTVLLLGGTSDIALAIAQMYAPAKPHVVLAARPTSRREAAATQLRDLGCETTEVDFDAKDTDSHAMTLDAAFAVGDIDVTVVAFGVQGDDEQAWQSHAHAVEMAQVNFTGAVSVGVLLGERLRKQGHGKVIALSSVAGERVRRSTFMYGATKAGFDGFYLNLGEALAPEGVKVTVVRPGQVRTKMSEGRGKAPLEQTAEQVAAIAVKAARKGKPLVWAPRAFRPVMSVLRHVPRPLFKKLPI
ncbi:decaprenylphospho-beta-D-erythro-pentofuranosid-2-ulose 2-reductase [Herbihabitans rhizosphaerae]|uniref:Decaprenylphospho-beta-D-erythro-pentofuranosid-2-ulose 2-reductase n=1 Tax=Herbihabitans rhizosphaerae TaxID=1872711 RepID=A0A4Q7L8Y4_9PSEU|nr:decaprenylphospho-beta-D-erythro-pentofuranosid-2-ulose 2-reductase [Herbihabitans rhizosphaerae]RZS45131.1 decaprenylphospho-beta-D-erythro-pentofuranosid-2-ulose 2-reductase [Herbihabitans rhizosphaerae]